MQSRRQSIIEVVTNTFAGTVGSWLISYVAMTLIESRAIAATVTVIGCTVWSLARGYGIRRAFNRKQQ
jgi:hypothetical protein